ncbi:MAG: secretion system protein [Halodesulfurarchaeum sp.]
MAAVQPGVPGPIPPDAPEAWYAPEVRAQYAIERDVVATVTEAEDGFAYEVRRPFLGVEGERLLERMADAFEDAVLSRPLTREDATDRMDEGIPDTWQRVSHSLEGLSPPTARRVEYHLCADLRALGELTGLALDERVRIGDVVDGRLLVHTRDFAPAVTDIVAETPLLDRVLSERLETYTVPFGGRDVPVTILRERLLGRDTFDQKYVVHSPDRLPGDERHIAAVIERIREDPHPRLPSDPTAYIERRATQLLRRRLALEASMNLPDRIRRALSRIHPRKQHLPTPPAEEPSRERVAALRYYVLRELAGDGPLTIPVRDERIKNVEANRAGERITVVPHDGAVPETGRMPTTLSFESADSFLAVAEQLAAEGGAELTAEDPAATVDIHREERDGYTLRCAVALPTGSDEGPHIAIRRSRSVPPTPATLLDLGRVTVDAVAAVWTVAEAGGRVLFAGPDGAEPGTALLGHLPFLPATRRTVAFGRTGAVLDLPHETGLTVVEPGSNTSEDGEANPPGDGLNADVVVIPELAGEQAFVRLEEHLTAGRGVFAAARIADRTVLARLAAERGIPPALFATIDLLVQLPPSGSTAEPTLWSPTIDVDGSRETGRTDRSADRAGGTILRWQRIEPSGDETDAAGVEQVLPEGSGDTTAGGEQIDGGFERRRRYVEFQRREGMSDRASLLSFLADLRSDEAATVERIKRVLDG